MKIAIIGAGFTGLSAAFQLIKAGHQVQIFELESRPGGLAIGFKNHDWTWSLEKHYHHLFTSDDAIQKLAAQINHVINFSRPKTSTFIKPGQIYQLDSPVSLLKFPVLPVSDRLRTALGLALMRFNPVWQPFEYITAKSFIRGIMGQKSWTVLWEPLFRGKFAGYTSDISASWFWARVYKRSPKLGYPSGGFDSLSLHLADSILALGGVIFYRTSVKTITTHSNQVTVTLSDNSVKTFDKLICTLPNHLFASVAPGLPSGYVKQITGSRGVGAVNLVLALTKPFLPDNIYWLNINSPGYPFLAVVEHTNFINPRYYANNHLIYIGNYLPSTHPYFQKTPSQLVTEFLPYLKKINPQIKPDWITSSWVWKANYAQPIVTTHYSKEIAPLATPLPGVYLANIQQVYPWDRGTNYAVELGIKVANELQKSI